MNRSTNIVLESIRQELDEQTAAEDINAFNTKLAKLLQRLKKDAGAKSVKQNYKGTGSQKFRRQLWCRFNNGAVIDLWLEKNDLGFGGVVARLPNGQETRRLPALPYGNKTPEQVYAEAVKFLKSWMEGKERA
jgi:hypothetical protein